MKIFVDVLILENYLVSMFLIIITARILHIKKEYLFIHLSSLIAALYTLTILFPKVKILSAVPFKILMPFIIVFIAFRIKDLLINIKAAFTYLALSFLLAGICFFIEIRNINITSKFVIDSFNYKKFLLGIIIIFLIVERIVSFIKDRGEITSYIYKLEIKHKECITSFYAFLDTGNELREPATNLPVIIVEKSVMDIIAIKNEKSFLIPYKLVDGSRGVINGFIPEEIWLFKKNKKMLIRAVVCFTDEILSIEKDYRALLSRGII